MSFVPYGILKFSSSQRLCQLRSSSKTINAPEVIKQCDCQSILTHYGGMQVTHQPSGKPFVFRLKDWSSNPICDSLSSFSSLCEGGFGHFIQSPVAQSSGQTYFVNEDTENDKNYDHVRRCCFDRFHSEFKIPFAIMRRSANHIGS